MATQKSNIPALRFPEFKGEWKQDKLYNLSENGFSNGVFNDPDKVGRGYKLINVKDMYLGNYIDTDKLTLVDIDEKEFLKNRVKWGDVFFTRSSLVKEGIAHTNIILTNSDDVTYDGHLIKMSPIKEIIYPIFLALFAKTSKARKEFILRGKTTTMTTIGQEDIGTVPVIFPIIAEQKKIADFLTAVDQKIAQLTEKKSCLEQYKKGVMQRLFTQRLRFHDTNGNPFPDWEEKELGEIASFFSGGTPTSSNRDFYGGDIPFIKSGEIGAETTEQFITKEALNESSAKLVNKGDLLYALYGATSGEVAISKIDGAINQAVLCIRATINTKFLCDWLSKNKNKILSVYLQGGQGNLSAEIVKSFRICFPTSKDEQQKIADFLTAIDAKITALGNQLTAAQDFKKSLLQKMFV